MWTCVSPCRRSYTVTSLHSVRVSRVIRSHRRNPISLRYIMKSSISLDGSSSSVNAWSQGLTLVHFSAQLERIVRDKGCA